MRGEYPRPNFVRQNWLSLNGTWEFGEGCQIEEGTYIEVPFAPQSKLSGIETKVESDELTYRRTFEVPTAWQGKRVLLHFGAVDYRCQVWVNGHCVGSHQGGQASFSFDITEFLVGEKQELLVRVYDARFDECQPRGKQFWKEEGQFIWYTQSSGIWQSVWLEAVEDAHIRWMHFTPDIDAGTVEITYELSEATPLPCEIEFDVTFTEERVSKACMTVFEKRGTTVLDVFHKKALRGSFHFTGWYWSPEQPSLFDVSVRLYQDEEIKDEVQTYFGMRKIEVRDGRVFLNNQPYYQKLVLDQGYWKDGLVTAPSEESYKEDILRAKAMGFNGCRKHEKSEDPVFLYWADKLGYLVWESMASFWTFTPQSAIAFTQEWMEIIERDYNHPSIVVWNMMNESWGVSHIYDNVQQQSLAKSLYHLAHGLDTTRLVIANDGWELVEQDVCAFHTYKHGSEDDLRQQKVFEAGVKSLDAMSKIVERPLFAKGVSYKGEPILLTEIGGITFQKEASLAGQGWGYTGADSVEAFVREYDRLISTIYASDLIQGFCYTQLSDVEQEKNGLLDENHEYKVEPHIIEEINNRMPTASAFLIPT
jgi:hypothetical protein